MFADKEKITAKDYLEWQQRLRRALMHFEFHQSNTEIIKDEKTGKEYEVIHMNDFIRSLFIFLPWNEYKVYDEKLK